MTSIKLEQHKWELTDTFTQSLKCLRCGQLFVLGSLSWSKIDGQCQRVLSNIAQEACKIIFPAPMSRGEAKKLYYSQLDKELSNK